MIRNAVTDWMWKNRVTQKEIKAATGASKSSVSMTVKGSRNDKRVLDYLKKLGCPHLYIETRNNGQQRKIA